MLAAIFGGLASWGPDFIRLGVAFTFIAHGYAKLFGRPEPGVKGLAPFLESMGFRPGLPWAYLVGCVEFFGGLCLLVGFLTRLAALLLAIEFLVVILKVKWSKGFLMDKGGWEWDWALFTMALSLLVTGPGRAAIDNRLHTGI